ncbi:MAG: FAD-binding protein [Planctomycetes bacterium]|nr:FAD-binding protein [Planctomycetota bacterium]
MKQGIYNQLKDIIDPKRVFDSPEARIASSYDASRKQHLPDVIVNPINTKEISEVLKLAYANGIPVYTRGAASSVTGSAVPIKGGIVLDSSLMNRIIEINPINLTATVEPGVIVADFQTEVEKLNLFYPPDPASAEFCTLGGNIATGAGGLRCIKYGTTRDYVLGLEVVLADGRIINTGKGTLKRVSGYDLTRLMVGSEGTLGVFTRINLKLIPRPQAQSTIAAFFADSEQAIRFSIDLLNKGILPRALEYMDATSLKSVAKYKPELQVPSDAQAMLLIELDGAPNDVDEHTGQVRKLLHDAGPIMSKRAISEKEAAYLWSIRKSLSAALFSITAQKVSEDICVPRSAISDILKVIAEIEASSGIPIATFGHLGDGNFHVNFLISSKEHENQLPSALNRLFTRTIELDGTLSGEHGIGLTKAKYFPLEWGPDEMSIFKQVKQLFDPKNILNPGKIFG